MLIIDYTANYEKTTYMAAPLGMPPPTSSSVGEKATYLKLKALSGASFDRAFVRAIVKDHQEVVSQFDCGDAEITARSHIGLQARLVSTIAAAYRHSVVKGDDSPAISDRGDNE